MRLVPGKKKQKNKKQNICFVLTDLKAGFKRILFSNKDTSVTHMAAKQHKREEKVAQERNRLKLRRQWFVVAEKEAEQEEGAGAGEDTDTPGLEL